MKINPYLFFNGQCEEAVKFYAKVLGGKIELMLPYKDMPGDEKPPAEFANHIMHARMSVGDQVILASDAGPGRYNKPQGFDVSLNVDTVEEAERIFKGLSEGAQSIGMPLGETFWAERFGAFVDKFGTNWMVNCNKPM
ncbi:VOC family protein [[Pseudomonas] carboxydohydrogena]|uniref:VOC family protein n=1 Tax=Afipia carboxydohydrogena TaxID=290 RepID=A0ABY8BRN9_AFICR|nr:VOC family protein [[Pseudomonas] carboxydohydrogena]WEF52659.1 VOC family protein [[Pseudomonas] carboxydohydrogena]